MAFNENQNVFRELADLLLQNKSIKSIALAQNAMSDSTAAFLIEPTVRSLNIESLKLDSNSITGVWLEKLAKRVALVGFNTLSHSGSGLKSATSQSILATESGDESMRLGTSPTSGNNGLINLGLEGNEQISDRGAEAIANMITIKSDATRSLKMINLNQCGIGNYGFSKLK